MIARMKQWLTSIKGAWFFMIASFFLLVPGLLLPMVTMSGSIKILLFRKTLFRNSKSILQTLLNLIESGNILVFLLILFFSVLVPVIKGVILVQAFRSGNRNQRDKSIRSIANISKWAMADVFVVGVFVAFLSAKATKNMDATIGIGFYCFTAYCLFSILALHLFKKNYTPTHPIYTTG